MHRIHVVAIVFTCLSPCFVRAQTLERAPMIPIAKLTKGKLVGLDIDDISTAESGTLSVRLGLEMECGTVPGLPKINERCIARWQPKEIKQVRLVGQLRELGSDGYFELRGSLRSGHEIDFEISNLSQLGVVTAITSTSSGSARIVLDTVSVGSVEKTQSIIRSPSRATSPLLSSLAAGNLMANDCNWMPCYGDDGDGDFSADGEHAESFAAPERNAVAKSMTAEFPFSMLAFAGDSLAKSKGPLLINQAREASRLDAARFWTKYQTERRILEKIASAAPILKELDAVAKTLNERFAERIESVKVLPASIDRTSQIYEDFKLLTATSARDKRYSAVSLPDIPSGLQELVDADVAAFLASDSFSDVSLKEWTESHYALLRDPRYPELFVRWLEAWDRAYRELPLLPRDSSGIDFDSPAADLRALRGDQMSPVHIPTLASGVAGATKGTIEAAIFMDYTSESAIETYVWLDNLNRCRDCLDARKTEGSSLADRIRIVIKQTPTNPQALALAHVALTARDLWGAQGFAEMSDFLSRESRTSGLGGLWYSSVALRVLTTEDSISHILEVNDFKAGTVVDPAQKEKDLADLKFVGSTESFHESRWRSPALFRAFFEAVREQKSVHEAEIGNDLALAVDLKVTKPGTVFISGWRPNINIGKGLTAQKIEQDFRLFIDRMKLDASSPPTIETRGYEDVLRSALESDATSPAVIALLSQRLRSTQGKAYNFPPSNASAANAEASQVFANVAHVVGRHFEQLQTRADGAELIGLLAEFMIGDPKFDPELVEVFTYQYSKYLGSDPAGSKLAMKIVPRIALRRQVARREAVGQIAKEVKATGKQCDLDIGKASQLKKRFEKVGVPAKARDQIRKDYRLVSGRISSHQAALERLLVRLRQLDDSEATSQASLVMKKCRLD